MVPCSVHRGKGIAILREKNKYSCQRGGGRENCYRTIAHAVADNRFTTALIPFFFFFALFISKKFAYMGIPFYYICFKISHVCSMTEEISKSKLHSQLFVYVPIHDLSVFESRGGRSLYPSHFHLCSC